MTYAKTRAIPQPALRAILTTGVALAALALTTAANAGECPAGKMAAGATKPVTVAAKDVTDKVLGMIDVAKEQGISDRVFRLRRLDIQPGGIVPWHSHDERPALIYIVEGEVLEYSSDCAVPITHKAGDVSAETRGVAHWWKNEGSKPVVLISADLLKNKMDKNM
jgi:quercetin dioxygenase-like cupin family protein